MATQDREALATCVADLSRCSQIGSQSATYDFMWVLQTSHHYPLISSQSREEGLACPTDHIKECSTDCVIVGGLILTPFSPNSMPLSWRWKMMIR